ncbi:MAG: hydroxyacylglutathione hydrolase [Robiginitomaculum sp.]|nr:MAG: hydroxyacylglutathione hydrolase [Robiginitomaculum sp.]
MSSLMIKQIPCLSDNYGYLVHDRQSGETASIDTPDAKAIMAALKDEGWSLTQIWNTHHHYDHAGGNAELVEKTGCAVYAPAGERDMIPNADHYLDEGDEVFLGEHRARVIDTPGHTRGHICYVFDDGNLAFVGDTLFALGCGRLFEGTPEQMWDSLSKLKALPDNMLIHCAHEYTADNARFAVTVEPQNADLQSRILQIKALRENHQPTVPMLLGLEKATNPFLRPGSAAIRANLKEERSDDAAVFAHVRRLKDAF